MSETLVDKISESIQEDIVSLKFQPDQRLHIGDLANQYNVGPGPVREALSRLLATELVVSLSQKGFRVASLSLSELHDIYQTRYEIESAALALSIANGTDDWEAGIIASYHLLSKFELEHPIKTTNDYKEWEKRHRAFNFSLINACGLNHLLRIQKHLYTLTERYRRQWLLMGLKEINGLTYAKEQKKIMDAALSKNSKLAKELLKKHFEKAVNVIQVSFTASVP